MWRLCAAQEGPLGRPCHEGQQQAGRLQQDALNGEKKTPTTLKAAVRDDHTGDYQLLLHTNLHRPFQSDKHDSG